MTQKTALLDLLKSKEWVCTTEFQQMYIPEFRSLIARMRKHEGFHIIDEPCLGKCGKQHNSKALNRWKLVFEPAGHNIKITKKDSDVLREFKNDYNERNRVKLELIKSTPIGLF